jgi:hypothetical protein
MLFIGVVQVGLFGFSWLVLISLRKPSSTRVGFIWISLDSLVRIETFQWVAREFRRKNFPLAFPRDSTRADMRAGDLGLAEEKGGS